MFIRWSFAAGGSAALAIWFADAELGWPESVLYVGMVLLAMVLLAMAVLKWAETLIQCGPRSLRAVPTVIRVVGRSRRAANLTGVVVVLLLILSSPVCGPNPYRLHTSLALVFSFVLLWLLPPYAIVLGESSVSTGAILRTVRRSIYPLRAVALLESWHTGYVLGSFMLPDDLRTDSERLWRSTVDNLLDKVELIIVDARTASESVQAELAMILDDPARRKRAVLLLTESSSAPVLMTHGIILASGELRAIRENELSAFLTQRLTGR